MNQAKYVRASSVAAMLGMDHRCSPLTLYLRMRGELDEADLSLDQAVQQGRYYEKATAEWCCDHYGMTLLDDYSQAKLFSGNLSGHIDFLVRDEHGKRAVLEVKNPFWGYRGGDWGEPGTDEIPKPYFVQTMVYEKLALDNIDDVADYGYVAARLSSGIARYKIPYDKDVGELLDKQAGDFLDRVRTGNPPSPQDEQDMRNLWPVTEKLQVAATPTVYEQAMALASIKEKMRELAKQESDLKAAILGFAQDAESVTYDIDGAPSTIMTLSVNRSLDQESLMADHPDLLAAFATLDTTRLRREQPALYEQYMKKPSSPTKSTRVIRLKLPKEGK